MRASLALVTVKKRMRMWGRPAVPNMSPMPSEMALIGSLSSGPGARSAQPFLWAAVAFSTSVEYEKPNRLMARIITVVPPKSSRQALMICTQVVATMPPKIT